VRAAAACISIHVRVCHPAGGKAGNWKSGRGPRGPGQKTPSQVVAAADADDNVGVNWH